MPRECPPCDARRVCNPATGRCVLRTGSVGRTVVKPPPPSKSPKKPYTLSTGDARCRHGYRRHPPRSRVCVPRDTANAANTKKPSAVPAANANNKNATKKPDCTLTLPQYTGTCWFNSTLMQLFFSDGSRRLLGRVWSRPWASATKNRGVVTALRWLYDLYGSPRSDATYRALDVMKRRPESILKILHTTDAGTFDFNPDVMRGGDLWSYLVKVLRFMNVRVALLEQTPDGKIHFNNVKVRYEKVPGSERHVYPAANRSQEGEDWASNPPEAIVLVRNSVDMGHLPAWWLKSGGVAPAALRDGMKTLVFGGGARYTADSVAFASLLHCLPGQGACMGWHSNHAIAGVTCDGSRKLYNGHLKCQVGLQAAPMPLVGVDWIKPGQVCLDDGHFKPKQLQLENYRTRFCFDTRKSYAAYLYVRQGHGRQGAKS